MRYVCIPVSAFDVLSPIRIHAYIRTVHPYVLTYLLTYIRTYVRGSVWMPYMNVYIKDCGRRQVHCGVHTCADTPDSHTMYIRTSQFSGEYCTCAKIIAGRNCF